MVLLQRRAMLRTMSSLLLDGGGLATGAALESTRHVLFVRHAESEHNVAERTHDWRLLLQRDHGITPAGWGQCAALRCSIADELRDDASVWARRDLRVYASPLTRAAQTALLSLRDVPALARGGLTLVPEARELGAGPVYGRDCLGEAVGGAGIRDRLLAAAATAAGADRDAFAALVDATPLDASRCGGKWWSSFEPHALARPPRVAALLSELAAGDGPAVLVCHSLLLRAIFRDHGADDATRDLADGFVPNCGVASVEVRRYDDGAVDVAGARLDFGGRVNATIQPSFQPSYARTMDDGSIDVPALAKGLNLVVGALIAICAVVFMASNGSYLAVVVGLETIVFAALLLIVELQADPALATVRQVAPFANTPRGEVLVSVLTGLFLFGMGAFGIAMGVILFAAVGLNAYVFVAHPEAVADRQDPIPQTDQYSDPSTLSNPLYPDGSEPYQPSTQPSTADL
ncbi:phosphoglycerate mutase [Aureococcus anophagefferens]|nr:phosphoglycerate mutase [Aureococcus anophagefferens]